jgi:hypothetical protein
MTHATHRRPAGAAGLMTAMMAVAFATLPFYQIAELRAEEDPFMRFPVVIHCKSKDTYHAFYVSRIAQDGTATYVASDRIAGTITLNGEAKAVGGEGGGSCVGRTLKELRASGQAYDLR